MADDVQIREDLLRDVAFHDARVVDVIEAFDVWRIDAPQDGGHVFRIVDVVVRMVDGGVEKFENDRNARLFGDRGDAFQTFDDVLRQLAAGDARDEVAGEGDDVLAVEAFGDFDVFREVRDDFVMLRWIREVADAAGEARDGHVVLFGGFGDGVDVLVAGAPEFCGVVSAVRDGGDTVGERQFREE